MQMGLCGQEVANAISAVALGLSSGIISSQGNQESHRLSSPPLREDDKDGHYVFAVGDNLTPRCNLLNPFHFFFNYRYRLFPPLEAFSMFFFFLWAVSCLQIRLTQKWVKVSVD
jgi:hypothetical protein